MPIQKSVLHVVTNLTGAPQQALVAKLVPYGLTNDFENADLIVLEPRRGHDLKPGEVASIASRVRQGATLLVTLPVWPQLTSMQLGEVLPAITWQASDPNGNIPRGPIACGWCDKDFFGTSIAANTTLPFFVTVEPLTSIQRGQSRYARYQRKNPVLMDVVQPGCQLWSRPLLLRDVQVRLRGADHAETPLLVTGRYGAGRTALFGSGFEQLSDAGLLDGVLKWLNPSASAPALPPAQLPEVTVLYGDQSVEIRLLQNSSAAMDVEVVARPYTWEGAPFGFEHDCNKKLTLLRGKMASVTMKLPQITETNFQALEFRDVFQVRLGVLDASGANLLIDRQLLVDFSAAVKIDVQADDIDQWRYPFDAPGTSFQRSFTDRCGARIGAYAYPPGAPLHGKVTVTNGLRDLTALAVAQDETTPENPTVSALTDGAIVANKKPNDALIAYSMWSGNPNSENVVTFTFPHAVTLAAITLIGNYKDKDPLNPESVTLELDGKRIASGKNLVERFFQQSGRVAFRFAPAKCTQMKLRIPVASGPLRRRGVALAAVQFEGWTEEAPREVQGSLTVNLVRVLDGSSQQVLQQNIALKPGEQREAPVACTLPSAPESGEFAAYRLEAKFDVAMSSIPVLVLKPPTPLLPLGELVPPDCAELGFIVTRGYRLCFPLGTGTNEVPPGVWATPDDLIWAYSRQLKEVSRRARTLAGRLYVSEGDMQHYAQPWRTFLDGVPLFDEAAPNFVAEMRRQPHWNQSDVAKLGNSDRWDTGPQTDTLHGWQDFVEFDAHLRSTGKAPLKGKTRAEITDEIHNEREDDWELWQFGQYMHNLRTLRDTFSAAGKRLLITAQGCPVIAGDAGREVAAIVQGMSDDCTWGMAEGSQTLTTGRQLATLAYNPVWKVSTLMEYGFVSNTLNSHEWHAPVCTVEPLRRMYYDRAWRATIWNDGVYRSVFTAGYNENVGISFQMSENDWQQWWQIEERHALLSPQSPLGAGIVISTVRNADPKHLRFNANDIFASSPDAVGLARVFQRLHEAGFSIPFASNATALAKWSGSAPLIVVNPEVFVEEEIATLEMLKGRGVRMVAISQSDSLAPRVQALFSQAGAIVNLDPTTMSAADAEKVSDRIHELLDLPLRFGKGVCGYGFSMSGTRFIVVEEWKNRGHITEVRLRARADKNNARACGLNDHRPLAVKRDGGDWVIEVPLRPGDGQVVALHETEA